MANLLINVLIPFVVFPSLTFAAFQLILRQSLAQIGLQLRISAICNSELVAHSYPLAYTNNPHINALLCGMVTFFHALMDPAHNPLLATLFPVVGVITLIVYLEAARDHRSFALSMPTPIMVLFQLLSMGVIMPIYALLFVVTGTASTSARMKVNQGNAEALLFGILVGYILPTCLMLSLVRPSVTAVWQGFPLLIAFAVLLHQIIRPPSRLAQSGHLTILVTLISSFIHSALFHVIYVWPVITDIATLKTLFVPVMLGDQADMPLADAVLEFTKWDMVFGIGAAMLATLWIADNGLVLIGMLVWHGIATIAFGPAAALAAVFLWRERRLNGPNYAHWTPQKME